MCSEHPPNTPYMVYLPTLGWFEGSTWEYMTNIECLGPNCENYQCPHGAPGEQLQPNHRLTLNSINVAKDTRSRDVQSIIASRCAVPEWLQNSTTLNG